MTLDRPIQSPQIIKPPVKRRLSFHKATHSTQVFNTHAVYTDKNATPICLTFFSVYVALNLSRTVRTSHY